MGIRRIVTGQDANGKSVFVSDTVVDAIPIAVMPGTEFHLMWGSDSPPALPTDGSKPSSPAYFPPSSGYRFNFYTLGPDSVTMPEDLDLGAALTDIQTKLPGLAESMEPDNPGMHSTETVDIDVIISGEVDLELDDGQQVHMKAGDCVIMNGVRHAWRNRTDEPVKIFVALLGAKRS
jgi:mannose-6-phosphate isomerase-like protein (cupin superfamily)